MPRANRLSLPGHVWHITHRCHHRQFLLKFARDRRCWRYWLFEARKRFDLCVLNYVVTSNHIHLLVRDRGGGEIAKSMQLIAGRTAQAYNRRKQHRGAYWEDRYHATAVDTDGYLARCMVYIDLNMVRAGAVAHPMQWQTSGYREIQAPPQRYRIIDVTVLTALLGIGDLELLRHTHAARVTKALQDKHLERDPSWSRSLAVGNREFVARFHSALGVKALHRSIVQEGTRYELREAPACYHRYSERENTTLSTENEVFLLKYR